MYGSDVIVKLLEQLGIEYVAYNPGATIRGLQESITNSGSHIKLITCCHEQIAVSIAHGYAKATGKLMAVLLHSNVGLLNASMSIFNAWCDRVPILILNGCGPMDSNERRPWIDWIHTSNSQGHIVGEFTKWYDQPSSLHALKESLCRAYCYAMSLPRAPVILCIDTSLQETNFQLEDKGFFDIKDGNLIIQAPAVAPKFLEEIKRELIYAKQPVVVIGRARLNSVSRSFLKDILIRFYATAIDEGEGYNISNNPFLYKGGDKSEIYSKADLILGLEADSIGEIAEQNNKAVIYNIGTHSMLISKWSADYRRFSDKVKYILGDPHVFLKEFVKLKKDCYEEQERDRRSNTNIYSNENFSSCNEQFDILCKIGTVLSKEEFLLTNPGSYDDKKIIDNCWEFTDKSYHIGSSGGAGLGYGLAASIGATLGVGDKKICVDIQSDGDFLFLPSGLWTLVHYKVPLLIILLNNGGYGNTRNHFVSISKSRGRSYLQNGSDLENPEVNYTGLAKAFGFEYTEKICGTENLEETLKNAICIVKSEKKPFFLEIKRCKE